MYLTSSVTTHVNKIKSNLNLNLVVWLNFSHVRISYKVVYTNNSLVPEATGGGKRDSFVFFLFSPIIQVAK